MSKLRKIKAPIPLLCYGVCLIGFLAMWGGCLSYTAIRRRRSPRKPSKHT